MMEAQWVLIFAGLAAVGSVVSAVVAGLARRDSRSSAQAAERSASASERSADAAELSAVAGQESVAEARRANDLAESRERAILNHRIGEALTINEDTGRRFRLVNNGDLSVSGVEFVNPLPTLADMPQRFDLPARGSSKHFRLTGGPETERPGFLNVKWDGLAEPVLVEFPYDVTKSIY